MSVGVEQHRNVWDLSHELCFVQKLRLMIRELVAMAGSGHFVTELVRLHATNKWNWTSNMARGTFALKVR